VQPFISCKFFVKLYSLLSSFSFFHFLVTVDLNNTGRSVDREHLPEAGVMDAAADDVMSGGADLCRMTLSIHLSTSGRAALKACSQHWVRELQRERPHWNSCVLQKLAEHQQIRGVSLQPIKSWRRTHVTSARVMTRRVIHRHHHHHHYHRRVANTQLQLRL